MTKKEVSKEIGTIKNYFYQSEKKIVEIFKIHGEEGKLKKINTIFLFL